MTVTEKRIGLVERLGHLVDFAEANDIKFIITAFYRTAAEQHDLYHQGLSMCDGYNVISNHQRWLAFDIAIVKDGVCVWNRSDGYDKLGQFWLAHGGGWDASSAGNLDDPYHFEYNPQG